MKRRMSAFARQGWLDIAVAGAVLLALWSALAATLGPYWVSSPWLVAERWLKMAANGDLWFHARLTIAEAIAGFALGALPGAAIPFLLRRHHVLQQVILPLTAVGYAVPKTALVPLFVLWLGIGPEAKVALVASAIFFIVFYSVLNGVRSVDERLLLSIRVLGARERQIVRQVVWPACVPYLFGGVRVALPYAVAGAVVGEIVSANRGLGYLVQYGANDFDTTLVFVALLTIMLIVIALDTALRLVQRRLIRWQTVGLDTGGARAA